MPALLDLLARKVGQYSCTSSFETAGYGVLATKEVAALLRTSFKQLVVAPGDL